MTLSSKSRTGLSVLLTVALAGPLAAGGGDRPFEEILRSRGEHDRRTEKEIVAALSDLGGAGAPDLLVLLSPRGLEELIGSGEAPKAGEWWGTPDRLPDLGFQALLRMPPEPVLASVSARAKEKDLDLGERGTLLRLVGGVKDPRGIQVLFQLVRSAEGTELLSHAVRGPFTSALAQACSRDPRALGVLDEELSRETGKLLEFAIEACEQIDRAESVELMLKWLGRNPQVEVDVIDAIAAVSARIPWSLRQDPRPVLRTRLVSKDPRVRGAAVVALGRLTDRVGFDLIVERLADPDTRVRRGALWALREMTGLDVGTEPEAWLAHNVECSRFLEKEEDRLTRELRDADPAVAVSAIRELARRPLLRTEIGGLLGAAAVSDLPEVGVAACSAIARIGARTAVPALTDALTSTHDEVRAAAFKALRELTEPDLPLDAEKWSAYVHLGRR